MGDFYRNHQARHAALYRVITSRGGRHHAEDAGQGQHHAEDAVKRGGGMGKAINARNVAIRFGVRRSFSDDTVEPYAEGHYAEDAVGRGGGWGRRLTQGMLPYGSA
jgi:hypothetical protein